MCLCFSVIVETILIHVLHPFQSHGKNLQKINTCHTVLLAIRDELIAWRYDRPPDTANYHPLLKSAIKEQRIIGWRTFLEGQISQKWAQYMSHYYNIERSHKTGKAWAAKVISYVVKFTFYIWEQQNKQLHNTARILDLEILPVLENSIKMEWLTGIGRLPASEYSRYFTMPIKQILSKPLEWKQMWFQIIQQAQILLDTSHLFNDEFATSHVLQNG